MRRNVALNRMKGQRLSELLTDIDDDLVADAMPPDWRAGKVKKIKKERRFLSTLGNIMDSGWTAAVLSALVAIGVISAIIWAGRNVSGSMSKEPTDPSAGGPGSQMGAPGNADRDDVLLGTGTPSTDIVRPAESAVSPPVPEEIPFPDAPVSVAPRYMLSTDIRHFPTEGYLLSEISTPADPTSTVPATETQGPGVVGRLDELRDRLDVHPLYIYTTCHTIDIIPKDENVRVSRLQIFSYDAELLYDEENPKGVEPSLLRSFAPEYAFFVVLTVEEHIEDGVSIIDRVSEYPVYIKLDEGDMPDDPGVSPPEPVDETFAPPLIEGYPSTSVTLDSAEEIRMALYGDMDLSPDSPAMQAFTERFCPAVSPWDMSLFIKLLRSVPVPLIDGEVPSYASYFPGVKGITFQIKADGIQYQFELILDEAEANRLMTSTLSPLKDPVVVSRNLRVVAQTGDIDGIHWINLGGVLSKTSLWLDPGVSLTGRDHHDLYGIIDVEMNSRSDLPEVDLPEIDLPETEIAVETLPPVEINSDATVMLQVVKADSTVASHEPVGVNSLTSTNDQEAVSVLEQVDQLAVLSTFAVTVPGDARSLCIDAEPGWDGFYNSITILDSRYEKVAELKDTSIDLELLRAHGGTAFYIVADAREYFPGISIWILANEYIWCIEIE